MIRRSLAYESAVLVFDPGPGFLGGWFRVEFISLLLALEKYIYTHGGIFSSLLSIYIDETHVL
jgi:hypothetical protein